MDTLHRDSWTTQYSPPDGLFALTLQMHIFYHIVWYLTISPGNHVHSDRSFPDVITKCKRCRRVTIAKIITQILSWHWQAHEWEKGVSFPSILQSLCDNVIYKKKNHRPRYPQTWNLRSPFVILTNGLQRNWQKVLIPLFFSRNYAVPWCIQRKFLARAVKLHRFAFIRV